MKQKKKKKPSTKSCFASVFSNMQHSLSEPAYFSQSLELKYFPATWMQEYISQEQTVLLSVYVCVPESRIVGKTLFPFHGS